MFEAVSLLISLIAVMISIATLQQNKKMVEESTRPYIVVYGRVTNFQSPRYYLVLKNLGQTGGTITHFESDTDLMKYSISPDHRPFNNICETFLAPGQSILCCLNTLKYAKDSKPITFNIDYHSNQGHYSETCVVNIQSEIDNIQTRAATENKELKIMSYTLQDLVEKLL